MNGPDLQTDSRNYSMYTSTLTLKCIRGLAPPPTICCKVKHQNICGYSWAGSLDSLTGTNILSYSLIFITPCSNYPALILLHNYRNTIAATYISILALNTESRLTTNIIRLPAIKNLKLFIQSHVHMHQSSNAPNFYLKAMYFTWLFRHNTTCIDELHQPSAQGG